jgi:carbon monoxide dehydrogenase subunit G
MQMTGQRLLPVPPQQAWNALNDPLMLKACIPGCESVTETGPNQYEVLMAARIGPVSAKFKGRLLQSDIVEPQSYTLSFDGQGGVAGFGKGKAEVRLDPVPEGTQLSYTATAQVGGKIAQIGSRLVDAAASKIADEFFAAFEKALTDQAQALQAAMAAASPAVNATDAAPGSASDPTSAPTSAPASHAAPDATPASSRTPTEDRQRWWRWAFALAAAAALMAWLGGKGPA